MSFPSAPSLGLPSSLRTQAYIDGEFVDAADGSVFETLAPATGEVLASVASCGPTDVDRAVVAARRSFESGGWRDLSPAARKLALQRFADLIEANAQELAEIDAVDAGKTITDCAESDIPGVIETFRWYAEAIDKAFGKVTPTSGENLGLVVREAIGVVGLVLPWNFPALMLAWKAAPALAAGNSIVVKPAELSPLSALRIAELAGEAGIPSGVFNVVPGLGETAGRALGLHMDVDVVSFTGSTEVGRYFLAYSSQSNLKRIVLECGGKSPQIVMPDMRDDLEAVAADLVGAAFMNAGQNCTAGSRILVHRSLKSALVERIVALTEQLVVGDPLDSATRVGPLIEEAAKRRTLRYVEDAQRAGATVIVPNPHVADRSGYFVAPTVIDDVTPDMPVAREEIFGPVVSVLGFDTEEEAISIANDTDFGLAATVWSKNIEIALRMARAVRAGTVAVNGYSEGDIATPFGGYKQSGFGGRDNGLEALDQYTELKTIWVTLGPQS